MDRRGGIASNFLTRHNGPKTSLLKTIKRRPTRSSDEPVVVSAITQRRSPATDDEPRSSTDESEDEPGLPPLSNSSNGDRGSTIDRKRPVRIRAPKRHVSETTDTKKEASALTAQIDNGGSGLSTSSLRSARKLLAPSSSPKRSLDEMQGGADTHLQDDFGFVGSSQTRKRNKRENTYGSQGQPSQQSRTYGQKHVKPGNKGKVSHDETCQSDFMNPVDRHNLDAMENLGNPFTDAAFKDPSKKLTAQLQASIKGGKEEGEEEEEEEEEKTGAFKMPQNLPSDILCSPREDQGPEFKMPRNVPSDILCSSQENQESGFRISTVLPPSPTSKFKVPGSFALGKRGTRNVSDIARDVLGGKRDLSKLPDDSDTILSNGSSSKPSAATGASNFSDSSSLSSPPDSPHYVSSQEAQDNYAHKRDIFTETPVTRCPMCREAVDAEFLNGFGDGRRMNVRNQAKFCRAHKQESAKVEWVTRGYPDIKWDGLRARIEKYHSKLEDVLEGRTSSYFKENLEANVKSGKNRTLAQTMMTSDFQALTPGYYGSRGARIMMEAIMSRFSVRIRKLAPKDRLISSGGVSGYVQAVMVPEIAVLLVQEDMGLDGKMARKVLMDSIDIGDLLNEDEDDDTG